MERLASKYWFRKSRKQFPSHYNCFNNWYTCHYSCSPAISAVCIKSSVQWLEQNQVGHECETNHYFTCICFLYAVNCNWEVWSCGAVHFSSAATLWTFQTCKIITHTHTHTYFWSISILPHTHKSFYSFLFSTCLYFSIAFFISLIVGRHYTNKLVFICKVKVLSVKLLNLSSPNWRRTNPTIHPWNEAPVISLMSGPRLGNLANSGAS